MTLIQVDHTYYVHLHVNKKKTWVRQCYQTTETTQFPVPVDSAPFRQTSRCSVAASSSSAIMMLASHDMLTKLPQDDVIHVQLHSYMRLTNKDVVIMINVCTIHVIKYTGIAASFVMTLRSCSVYQRKCPATTRRPCGIHLSLPVDIRHVLDCQRGTCTSAPSVLQH